MISYGQRLMTLTTFRSWCMSAQNFSSSTPSGRPIKAVVPEFGVVHLKKSPFLVIQSSTISLLIRARAMFRSMIFSRAGVLSANAAK